MITQVNLLFGLLFLLFHMHVSFALWLLFFLLFSHPSIFSTSVFHPSFFPAFFSFFNPLFILLLYSSTLFFSLCIVLLNEPQLCTPKSSFLFYTHILYLGFFMNLIFIMPFQHAPNTHLWLILSLLGLLRAPPSLDDFLGGFLACHNFPYYGCLYFHNFFDPLYGKCCNIFFWFMCCLFHLASCSGQFSYHPQCFFL